MTMCNTHSTSTNLLPSQLATGCGGNNNLALAVKTHDLHADRAGSTALNLMLMAKEVDTCFTTSIVQSSFDKHPQHGTLASIDIAHDSNARLNDLVNVLRTVSYDHLPTEASVFRIPRADLNIAANIPGHQGLVVGLDEFADGAYPLEGKVPVLLGEAHALTTVLESNIEQDLAVALGQALLDVLSQRGDILLGGVNEQRLQADVRLRIVGQAELVEDAQLVVVLEGGGGLAGASKRLLLLHVFGEVAERLPYRLALQHCGACLLTYTFAFPPLDGVLFGRVA